MSRLRRGWLISGMLAGAAMTATAAGAADEPAAVLKYRQNTMDALGGHMGALAAVAKGDVTFTDDVAVNAEAIHGLSQNLARLFPAGSGKDAGKSASLPAIWEKPAEFEQAVKVFQEQSAKLVEVAKGGDQAAIAAQIGALGKDGCGGCHQNFREKS